jgi:hypothetical protein
MLPRGPGETLVGAMIALSANNTTVDIKTVSRPFDI